MTDEAVGKKDTERRHNRDSTETVEHKIFEYDRQGKIWQASYNQLDSMLTLYTIGIKMTASKEKWKVIHGTVKTIIHYKGKRPETTPQRCIQFHLTQSLRDNLRCIRRLFRDLHDQCDWLTLSSSCIWKDPPPLQKYRCSPITPSAAKIVHGFHFVIVSHGEVTGCLLYTSRCV